MTLSQVLAATEILDQKQETTSGQSTIGFIEPAGQSFIPTLTPLTSVEVFIRTPNPQFGDDTITCRIRDSTIGGTILGTASKLVSDDFEGWLRFTFDPPIIVDPGSTYVIELDVNKKTHAWLRNSPGINAVDPYPDGVFIASGIVVETDDAMFRTYSLDPTVGGTIVPVDKIAVLTPYLALAGLILAVSTVYVIKKRKA